MPWVKESECVGCGVCVSQCPAGAIFMNANGFAEVDQSKCTNCGACFGFCPQNAFHPNSENMALKGRGIGRGGGMGRGMGRGGGMGRGRHF